LPHGFSTTFVLIRSRSRSRFALTDYLKIHFIIFSVCL
jgi:hypothetical protein